MVVRLALDPVSLPNGPIKMVFSSRILTLSTLRPSEPRTESSESTARTSLKGALMLLLMVLVCVAELLLGRLLIDEWLDLESD